MSKYKKYIRGTNGNDQLVGDDGNNTLSGRRGDDQLQGLAGDDLLLGGKGDDALDGGTGNDLVFGGTGNDSLLGGEGNDILIGDSLLPFYHGDDSLDGGAGNDRVFGKGGNDRGIYSVTENLAATDWYDGGAGSDTLVLKLTQSQWQDPAVQQDLAAYRAFLENHVNPSTGEADGQVFSFSAFDLTVRRWEALEVEIVDADDNPVVVSFTSTSADGSYTVGSTINVTATISRDIQSGNELTVVLNTGDSVVLTAPVDGNTLVGAYTVGAGDTSDDLTVSSFTIGAVVDDDGNPMVSTALPAVNIADGSAIVIDTLAPTITAVSIPDVALNVGDVATVTLTVEDDGGDTYTNVSGTIAGFALSGLTRVDSATYTAQFTVTEGGADVAAGADIPVSVTIEDSAGNTSAVFSTPISQAADAIDANSPTLSSSTPIEGATGVALDGNIVLNFNENIALGTGNIVISDGTDTISIDVAAHGGQLAIAGGQLTINPTANLANGASNYSVQIDPTAIDDSAGNSYVGIADTTTLDFTTEVNTAVVVFDHDSGTNSDHSGRTFSAGESYTIYVVVDQDSPGATSFNTLWTGGGNLGADDQIILVGSGSLLGSGVPVTNTTTTAFTIRWTNGGVLAAVSASGGFFTTRTATGFRNPLLWSTSAWASVPSPGLLATLPAAVAASQVLS